MSSKSTTSKAPKSVSRSAKAGIVFPVGRVATYLKKGKYAKRIAAAAPVYLSAVLEYLAAEVLEVAGDHAKFHKKNRITPAQIQSAVRNDDELAKLCHGVLIPRAGALPRYP